MRKDFTETLRHAVERGIGQLVDADMESASARLQALKVQDQLAAQMLSVANGNQQMILTLFRSAIQ
jgi:flagellin